MTDDVETEYVIHGVALTGLERRVTLDHEPDSAETMELLIEEAERVGIDYGSAEPIIEVDDVVEK